MELFGIFLVMMSLVCELLVVWVIREEFNFEYCGVIIDDWELYEEVCSYVGIVNFDLVDWIEYYDV